MTQLLVGQIAQAAGLPSTVRVGLVASTAPLTVSVQGSVYAEDAVGIVQPDIPTVGQPVVLLGQAGLSGGDPATWLVLGSVRPATMTVTEWSPNLAPTLLNGWVNLGSGWAASSYWRDPSGVVHLDGLVANGVTTPGTDIFILPEGFRPAEQILFAVNTNNLTGRVDIYPDGRVLCSNGISAGWIAFCGISFRATG